MSFDQNRNDTVSLLIKLRESQTYFKGPVERVGSYTVDGMTRFVFTIKWDTGETEVYSTVPNAKYFSEVLQFNDDQNQMILTTSLAYASQVKAGDKVSILTDNDVNRIIHFIETVAPSEEEARELDRT